MSDDALAVDEGDEVDAGSADDGRGAIDVHAMLTALESARSAASAGDARAVVGMLRGVPDAALLAQADLLGEVAGLVAEAARAMHFDDLAATAEAVRCDPCDVHALYRYGFDCSERGVPALAVAPLAAALALQPDAGTIRMELVAALQALARYTDAVRVLLAGSTLDLWVTRYLLVLENLLAGDLDGARQWHARLGPAEEQVHEPMALRLARMLERVTLLTGAATDGQASALGTTDLRGWHFALNSGVLLRTSGHGAESMNGRYAWVQESPGGCRRTLDRLCLALSAAGRSPSAVIALPDRSSRVVAGAAGALLGLPVLPWDPMGLRAGVAVVGWSLTGASSAVVAGLTGAAGVLLVEYATCWTAPPALAADVSGILHQVAVAPWHERIGVDGAGRRTSLPADRRPDAELVADVLGAAYDPEESAHDPDAGLAAFVSHVASRWATGEVPRDRVWSPGPVTSSRFD